MKNYIQRFSDHVRYGEFVGIFTLLFTVIVITTHAVFGASETLGTVIDFSVNTFFLLWVFGLVSGWIIDSRSSRT